MHVIQIHRKPFPGSHSIEGLFETLRASMADMGVIPEIQVAPKFSKGVFQRLANVRWAASLQADVLHVTGDIHYVVKSMRPEKTLLTIHDIVRLEQLSGIRRFIMQEVWFRMPLRRCHHITVISEETKRKLISRFSFANQKIEVIPDCVDPAFQGNRKSAWPIVPEILHIGTKENKNLPRLVEAIRGLSVRLHVIGKLSNEQNQILSDSKISFRNSHGLTMTEIVQVYADADIVAFVSLAEGFGMPILEAQSMCRPVITSNCSSMPEVAGDGALLVDPTNVGNIRDGICRLMNEPDTREALIQRGESNVRRFTPQSIARCYIDLYQRIHQRDPNPQVAWKPGPASAPSTL